MRSWAAPLGIIGQQFSDGSTAMSATTAAVMGQHRADGRVELVQTRGTQSFRPEGVGELDEIGQRLGQALGVAPSVEQFLPLADHAHAGVVEDEHLHREAVLAERREFLDVHEDAGLAGDVDDQGVWLRHLYPGRRGKPVSHSAQAAAGHPAVGFLEAEVLCRPHLVLPHLGGDESVLAGLEAKRMQSADRVLRLDDGVG